MSEDRECRHTQGRNERDGSVVRSLPSVEEKDCHSTTRSAENATISGYIAKGFENEKATQHESQVAAGASAGNDEESQQERAEQEALERVSTRTPVHSIFSKRTKLFIVFMTAWGGLFSPISANIYFAALNPLARDLKVSASLINLT